MGRIHRYKQKNEVMIFNVVASNTREGEVITAINLDTDQEKAKLDVVLLEGFRKVAAAPRCGTKPVTL